MHKFPDGHRRCNFARIAGKTPSRYTNRDQCQRQPTFQRTQTSRRAKQLAKRLAWSHTLPFVALVFPPTVENTPGKRHRHLPHRRWRIADQSRPAWRLGRCGGGGSSVGGFFGGLKSPTLRKAEKG